MKRALVVAVLVLAAGSLTVCGPASVSVTASASTSDEELFLDTVRSRTNGPGWVAWPSDAELLRQGYRICELLRTPGLMRGAIPFMFDPIPANMNQVTQGDWEIDVAEMTLC